MRYDSKLQHLRNDDVSKVSFFPIVHVGVDLFLDGSIGMTCVMAMGVVVPMMRGMCMHPNDVHSTAFLFPEDLDGIGGADPRLFVGGAVESLLALVVLRSEEIEEERQESSHHGEEAGEGELGPREGREAGVLERFGGVGEHMDESRGQDDSGGEGLGGHEEVAVGAEEAAVASDERDGDSAHAGQEDGGDGHEFEDERGGVVSAEVRVMAGAGGVGHGFGFF